MEKLGSSLAFCSRLFFSLWSTPRAGVHPAFPGAHRCPGVLSVPLPRSVPWRTERSLAAALWPAGLLTPPPPALLPSDQNECIIANPAFVVYSSVVSFYVPFIVTLLVYIKIYIVLRRRRKRVNTKRSSRAFRANLKAPLKVLRTPLPSRAHPPITQGAGPCSAGGRGHRVTTTGCSLGWRVSQQPGQG